jgi:hypothetical protein
MKYRATGIEYDFDDEDEGMEDLDDTSYYNLMDQCPDELIVDAEDEDAVADAISDKTGFLVLGIGEIEPLGESKDRVEEYLKKKLLEGRARPTELKDSIRNSVKDLFDKPNVQFVSIGSGRYNVAEVDLRTGGQRNIFSTSMSLKDLENVLYCIAEYKRKS